MVADEHDSPDPYIELGPNTGVWVPNSDLPGALIIPPGSAEEWSRPVDQVFSGVLRFG
jgi:hypothetical protein